MTETLRGKVEAVLVSRNSSGISEQVQKIQVFAGRGVKGDVHYGSTRLLDVREAQLLKHGLPKGIEIYNARQFSAISQEELDQIAQKMGHKIINYGLLGENIVFRGIDNLSTLPSGSLIFFKKDDNTIRTAVLKVESQNNPCEIPENNIAEAIPDQKPIKPFQKAAYGQRGVVGTIYSSGFIHEGDQVEIQLTS